MFLLFHGCQQNGGCTFFLVCARRPPTPDAVAAAVAAVCACKDALCDSAAPVAISDWSPDPINYLLIKLLFKRSARRPGTSSPEPALVSLAERRPALKMRGSLFFSRAQPADRRPLFPDHTCPLVGGRRIASFRITANTQLSHTKHTTRIGSGERCFFSFCCKAARMEPQVLRRNVLRFVVVYSCLLSVARLLQSGSLVQVAQVRECFFGGRPPHARAPCLSCAPQCASDQVPAPPNPRPCRPRSPVARRWCRCSSAWRAGEDAFLVLQGGGGMCGGATSLSHSPRRSRRAAPCGVA